MVREVIVMLTFCIVGCIISSVSLAKPTIVYFQKDLSRESIESILDFNERISRAYTEITGVDPVFFFKFYCSRFPYLTWSYHREFFNTGNCEDWWYEMYFYEAYAHEIAQVFFVYNLGSINDDVDSGKYKRYFSPYYVVRPSEHISFALSTIFWNDFAEKHGVRRKLGGELPILGYKISLDSEFYKALLTINPATVHHTEVDYYRFINFSFYVGQMLYVKLYLYNPNFFKDFIPKKRHVKVFKTIASYANYIIESFKKEGPSKIDGIPIEEFVWKHPDFRRFAEDYTKKYYFDIILVDYKKRENTPFFFFDITRINPSNFCFILTSFKDYTEKKRGLDHSIDNLVVDYRIVDNEGRVVTDGKSKLLLDQYGACSNIIPRKILNGKYFLEAEIRLNDGSILKDKVDFVVKNERNFYVDELPNYSYIIMRNVKVGNSCYYIKLSFIEDLLKLDEVNQVQCLQDSSSDVIFNSDGSITLKNIFYKGSVLELDIRPTDRKFFFKLLSVRVIF